MILQTQPAMRHYEAIRRELRETYPNREGWEYALQQMAQVTWPIRVVRLGPDQEQPKPRYVLLFVHGHGMEEDLWFFLGDHRERDAVRLSILFRNLYYSGNRDALSSGHLDSYLEYAMPEVERINASSGS